MTVTLGKKREAETGSKPTSRGGDVGSRFGLLLAWGIAILVFSVVAPHTFPRVSTFSGILGSQAVLVFLALAVVFPLTAGDYDLSIGGTLSLSAMVLGILNAQNHINLVIAIVAAVLVGLLVGAVNGFLVVRFKLDPFIVTLGMGTVLDGLALWSSNSNTITGVSQALPQWTVVEKLLQVPLAFYYGLILVVLAWYVLEYTSFGRRLLYVGRGREVARLSGVSVGSSRVAAFIISGSASAVAGVLYVGTTSSSTPGAGDSYLLPAYAAVFLGATAIKPGRFNSWGTLVAVYFLVTGITGLTLVGANSYVQDLFYGAALIAGVLFAQLSNRGASRTFRGSSRLKGLATRGRAD